MHINNNHHFGDDINWKVILLQFCLFCKVIIFKTHIFCLVILLLVITLTTSVMALVKILMLMKFYQFPNQNVSKFLTSCFWRHINVPQPPFKTCWCDSVSATASCLCCHRSIIIWVIPKHFTEIWFHSFGNSMENTIY